MDKTAIPTDGPATSCSILGSDDGVPSHVSSSGLRPPKKRRTYLSLGKPDALPRPSVSATAEPVSGNTTASPSPSTGINLDSLTYYPARESTFEGIDEEASKQPSKALAGARSERSVLSSGKSMRAAVRHIAKQRRRRLRTRF